MPVGVRAEQPPSSEEEIYDDDTPVYESAPASGQLVTVVGVMAASWSKGFVLTTSDRGVKISVTW